MDTWLSTAQQKLAQLRSDLAAGRPAFLLFPQKTDEDWLKAIGLFDWVTANYNNVSGKPWTQAAYTAAATCHRCWVRPPALEIRGILPRAGGGQGLLRSRTQLFGKVQGLGSQWACVGFCWRWVWFCTTAAAMRGSSESPRWTGVGPSSCLYVISGFYMALILSRKYVGAGSVRNFYLSRLFRLWPTYLTAVVFTLGCYAYCSLFMKGGAYNWFGAYWSQICRFPILLKIWFLFSHVFMVGYDLFVCVDLTRSRERLCGFQSATRLPDSTRTSCQSIR